jgi:hypothetical protein
MFSRIYANLRRTLYKTASAFRTEILPVNKKDINDYKISHRLPSLFIKAFNTEVTP